jgi:hypothetical protein
MNPTEDLLNAVENLIARVGQLEASAANHEAICSTPAPGSISRLTAAIDEQSEEEGILHRLRAAEQQISQLLAQTSQAAERSTSVESVRKTLPPATLQLLAKQGVDDFGSMEMNHVDAALVGLSIEQRMAVKAQLIRAGAFAS